MNTGFCFGLRVQLFQPADWSVWSKSSPNTMASCGQTSDAARQLALIHAVGAARAFLRDVQIVVLVDNIIRAGGLALAAARA